MRGRETPCSLGLYMVQEPVGGAGHRTTFLTPAGSAWHAVASALGWGGLLP